jgi:hypothetical protein
MEQTRNASIISAGKLEGPLENKDVDGRIIFKWITAKQDVAV